MLLLARHLLSPALQGHVQDLQVKLKEAHRQRSKERWEHQAQLAALESQIRAKLAAFKTQHKMFKAQGGGNRAGSAGAGAGMESLGKPA